MSGSGGGLFSRLARRASGTREPRLHAPARLPFHAPPALATTEETRDASYGARVVSAGAETAGHTATAGATTIAAPQALFAHAGANTGRRESVAASERDAAGTLAASAIDLAQDLPAPLLGPIARKPGRLTEPADAPAQSPGARSPGARSPGRESSGQATARPAAPLPEVSEPASRPASGVAPGAGTWSRIAPAPPKPARGGGMRVSGTSSAFEARPQPGQAGPAATDEIHIHIGRIEVTAVQEAATPRARERAATAPMSLQDYLDRRSRGGA
ncbi:protein of unknown function [Thauera humireducens]|nr:protein of unknown function [Thauera humireducens]